MAGGPHPKGDTMYDDFSIQTVATPNTAGTNKLRLNHEVLLNLGASSSINGVEEGGTRENSCEFSCTCSAKCSYDFTCGC